MEINEGVIWHVFGCGLLTRYSPATLVKLSVALQGDDMEREDIKEPIPTIMQSNDALTNDSYPNLKMLTLENYIPQNLYEEFMYLKKKFVNLERLATI